MSLAVLVKVEDRNEEVCCSFHWRLMLPWLRNIADCLKVRLHNQSSSKQRTGLIIALLAIVICLPLCDKKFKSNHQMFLPGAWTARHETNYRVRNWKCQQLRPITKYSPMLYKK